MTLSLSNSHEQPPSPEQIKSTPQSKLNLLPRATFPPQSRLTYQSKALPRAKPAPEQIFPRAKPPQSKAPEQIPRAISSNFSPEQLSSPEQSLPRAKPQSKALEHSEQSLLINFPPEQSQSVFVSTAHVKYKKFIEKYNCMFIALI